MRTINVTGGYSDYAVVTVTELDGQDLTATTIKMALLPRNTPLPAAGDNAWVEPATITHPSTGTAIVSLYINAGDPGLYDLWLDLIDSPTQVPLQVGPIRII